MVPSCHDCAVLVGVVDQDTQKWNGISEDIPKFEDLASALDATKPDLVVNVTPPNAHCELTAMLLRKNLAVLCEKPIADSFEDAVRMGEVLKETNGFLAIGENYRYNPLFREAKRVLETYGLGNIHHIHCFFRHYHPDYSKFYHGSLRHPLLEDVTIHHLDLARYLSGQEPTRVWCKEFAAPYSWYGDRPACADIVTEMSHHVMFHYSGTLASPASSTTWNGTWEIECDHGILRIEDDRVFLLKDDTVIEVPVWDRPGDSRPIMLREICYALKEGRNAETDYTDNFKSFHWMQKAIQSSETQNWVDIVP